MINYTPNKLILIQNNKILQNVLFKVGVQDLLYETNAEYDKSSKSVPHYKALINLENNEVLSIVTENYHLVTNAEALNMGKAAIRKLFDADVISDSDFVPFRVWHNKKKTACSIDLIYQSVRFDVFKQDTWLPFVRVINSYNKQYKLKFEIGFVRSICTNSIIFEGKTIKYDFAHSKGAIPAEIQVSPFAYQDQKASFITHLENFAKYNVKRDNVISHVYKALNIEKKDFEKKPEIKADFDELIINIWSFYSKDDNNTAYSLFNVLTDLSSNHPLGKLTGLLKFDSNIYTSTLISKWVKVYSDALKQKDYNEVLYLSA